MGIEIERKFLLIGDTWKQCAPGAAYRQGYLGAFKGRTVRVRTADDQGFLTIKGISAGASRLEYEYEIPLADANEMLNILCEKPLIEKIRYKIKYAGFTWEVDEFFGENEGLVVAEIELAREDQPFEKPEWIGEEVTGDTRYYNASLVRKPYSQWK